MQTTYSYRNIIKSVCIAIVIAAWSLFLCGAPVRAATDITLSATNVTLTRGSTFHLQIVLDPHGIANYTAKIALNFPPALLRLQSFTFAGGWIELAQPGYDAVDNNAGLLIKTGGYPRGISVPVVFGTATFLVISTGQDTIAIDKAASLVLNAKSQNIRSVAATTAAVKVVPVAVPYEPVFNIPTVIPRGFVFENDLARGDKNIDVAYLQICLKSKFHLYSGIVDGNFTGATEQALAEFQRAHVEEVVLGTGQSSKADVPTRVKLNALCSGSGGGMPEVIFDVSMRPLAATKMGLLAILLSGFILAVVGYLSYAILQRVWLRKKISDMDKTKDDES